MPRLCGAHPRSRGEHTGTPMPLRSRVGSSPLTRGAQLEGHKDLTLAGLIPAHAGSTEVRCKWFIP